MMKFVQACTKAVDGQEDSFSELIEDKVAGEQTSFKDFIVSKKFPASINDFLVNAVAMSPTNQAFNAFDVRI